MTDAMKSLASLVRGTLKCGIKVNFTEAELKLMGIKVPKSKMHLIKQEEPIKSYTFKLPVRIVERLKRGALAAHKPYNMYVSEALARIAAQ